MSLRQRIEDDVAAPTDATLDLLGPVGAFVFDRERCLIELVPEILLFAAGDPFVPTAGPQFNGACAFSPSLPLPCLIAFLVGVRLGTGQSRRACSAKSG